MTIWVVVSIEDNSSEPEIDVFTTKWSADDFVSRKEGVGAKERYVCKIHEREVDVEQFEEDDGCRGCW